MYGIVCVQPRQKDRGMTVNQAIDELEDRGVPEVIELIRQMDRLLDELRMENDSLKVEITSLKYGVF